MENSCWKMKLFSSALDFSEGLFVKYLSSWVMGFFYKKKSIWLFQYISSFFLIFVGDIVGFEILSSKDLIQLYYPDLAL